MDMITIDPIEIDNIVDTAEEADGIQITGTSTAIVGSLVTVVVDGIDYTTTVTAMGTWAIVIPAGTLPDALYSVTADVTDAVQASTSFDLAANNDPVTEPMPELTGAVTEIADGAMGENVDTLEATGDIEFTDADIGDVHSVGTAPVGGGVGFIGLFFAGLSDPATGDGVGTVTWTFQVNDSVLDSLNDGEVVLQDYDITIDDGFGGSVTETVTITITGTADAAVVTGDTSGASTEDSGVTTTGNLDHTDADSADADDAWNTAVTVNGVYGTLTITAAGVWEYTLNDADPTVDALAVGEPLVDTITVETTDGTTQDITINITGANDAPTVGAAIDSTLTEDEAPRTLILLSGAADVDTLDVLAVSNLVLTGGDDSGITVNPDTLDIDPNAYNYLAVGESAVITYSYDVIDGNGGSVPQTATITVTGENDAPIVTAAATGGNTEDATPFSVNMLDGVSDPDLSDILNVDAMSVMLVSGDDSGVTVNGNALDVDPSAYDYLAVGESAVIVYSYDVLDGNGGLVAQTATITITGENDAPTIGAAITGGSTEDDAAFSVDMLAGAADVDLTDVLSVDGPSITTVSGDDSGINVLGNSLDVDPNAYNYLAVGESAVIVISYNIIDGNGGSVAQTATITITGENDAPTVAAAVTGGGTEDDALVIVDLLDGASDPDLSDVLNVSSLVLTGGDFSGVTIVGNDLFIDPGAYNHLAVGESEVITFSYDVVDGNGGSVPQTVTVTITGENDAPTVAAAVTDGGTEDDAPFSVDMLAGASDVDLTDILNVDGMSVMLVSGDDSGVTVNGNALDVDPNAYNYLAVGESAIIVYSYDIIDGNGGSVPQTATITITGENDTPTVGAAVSGGSTEDDAAFSVDLLDGASDPDLSDVLNVDAGSILLLGGDDSGVTINGNTLDVDPNAYNYLAVGEIGVIAYSYDIIDGNGGLVSQTATITITGENDAPTVAADVTGGSTEDDAPFSVDMLAGASDVDLTDTLNVDGMSVVTVSGDDSGVTLSGNDLDVDPNAYDYLAVGESEVIVIGYDIIDGNGGSVPQTATITITGENDAPVITTAMGGNEGSVVEGGEIVDTTPAPLGVDTQVNTTTTDQQLRSNITALDGGGFVVTWTNFSSGVGFSASGQRYDASGTAVGGEFQIGDGGEFNTSVEGLPGGGFVVIWTEGGDVHGQLYDAAGATSGAVFDINSTLAGGQDFASVTTLNGGGFVVTWSSTGGQDGDGIGVFGQRYDAAGAAVGGEFQVNTTTAGDQKEPFVAALSDGGFIVGWESFDGGGNEGIFAQRFDANGVMTGTEFQVNTTEASFQRNPAMTSLSDGGFIIVWEDNTNGSLGQRYNADGTASGAEFSVAPNTAIFPQVVSLSDGGFVISWTGVDSDSFGIFGQRYDASGATLGAEFQINSIEAGQQIVRAFYGLVAFDILTDGTLVATWSGQGTEEVFVRLIDVPVDGAGTPTATGTLTSDDVDNGATATWTGDAMGVYGSIVIDPVTGVWTYTLDQTLADPLSEGQVEIEVFTMTVTDDQGASVTQDVTITVTGSNDAPTVSAGVTGAGNEDGAVFMVDMLTNASDIDIGAVLSVANVVLVPGVTFAGTTLTIDPSDASFQFLALGETLDIIVSYDVEDEHGASVPQTATITITGENDAPTVSAAVTAAANEDDAAFLVDMLEFASDVDTGAVLSVANVTGLTAGVTFAGTELTVDPADAAFQSLALGETLDIIVSYDVVDEHGASVAQTATITLTGTNDAPTVSAGVTGAGNEDGAVFMVDMLTNASDVDNGAVLSIANVTGLVAGVTFAGATELTIDPSDASFQFLAVGETLDIIVSYDVEDEHGASVAQTATITITGTNDDPTVAAAVTGGGNEDDAGFSVDLLAGASDVDLSDTLNVDFGSVSTVLGDDSGVTLNGNNLDVDPNAYNHLDDGESEVIVISYDIIDGNGGFVGQTATITITGANDAPIIDVVSGLTGTVTEIADGAAGENTTVTQFSNTITFTDPEISDAHSAVITPTGPNVASYIGIMGGALTDTATGDGVGEISWVFNINDSELDYLAAGEVIIQTYEVSVQDDGAVPLSDTEIITITITGTNDAPIISSGAQAAAITETAMTTGDATTHDEGGTITFDDVDISDVDHALTTSLVTTGVTGGLPDAMTLDGFMTLSGLAVGMGSGTFDWDFSAADSEFDYLADGEIVTLTYTVTIDDGDGGTIDQDIILTVTGTNDAPTTSIQPGDFISASLDETDVGLTAGSTVSVQDVDISDVVTVSVDSVVESGDVSGIANGTLMAMLGVDMGAIIDAVSTDGTINWSFDSGAEAFDYLADGESLVLTYSLLVEDDAMGSTLLPITITINGTNDQPVITLGDDTGVVTEDAAMPNLTDAGSFAFSDADDGDVLVATVAQEGAATTSGPSGIPAGLTAALAGAMGIVQTGTNDGTIDWTFTIDNALTQYLGEGETVTVVYRVSIDDGSGAANAVQTQDITVTITGTNDIPVATGDVLAINEDDVLMGDVSTNDMDADTSAVLNYTLDAPIDGLTMNADGSYTFDADDPAYAHLADGAVEIVNAAYTVTDDQGATDTETLVITITGVNDAPNLAAPLTGTAFEDDTSFLIDLLSGASDVDDGDAVSIANVSGLSAGLILSGNLLSIDPTDAAFQSLALGEELIIVVSYDVEDLNGGVSPQTATITITGTNDDPVALAVVGAADEDGPAVTVMADFTDVDALDTHTFTVDTTGTLGSVTNNMDGSFDYDANGAFESLAVGEMTTDTFTYTVDDGNGGTSTETVTITITGQNDAPVALAVVGATGEDGPMITVSADFTDVDALDTHTFTVDTTGTVGAVTNNMDGTFDYDASGAFDSLTLGQMVTDTFTYTVDDGNGGTSTETVTITITGANDAPTITGLTNDTVSEFAINGTIVGEAITNDVDGGGLLVTFTMIDDAGGRFAIDQVSGEITVVDGLALDFEQSQMHSIMVEVSDGLDSRIETLQINISDVGPEIITADDAGRTLVGGATHDIFTGGLGDDIFDGGAGNDRFDGGSGTNMLSGGDGSDTFIGGDGVDAIDGGAGFDTVDYRGAGSSVEFDLGTGGTLGDAAGDTYTGLERAYGSDFDDVITGTAGNEFLYGEGGNDTINAGDGIDRVFGGDGNDIQRGDGGNDTLYGSAGSDQLNGGTGFDIANYTLAAAAVIVDMAAGGTGGDADGDTYFGIEAVYGSAFDDSITGNSTNNQLRGNGGNDSLFGAAGNDSLFGGAGADALDGGTGIDTAFYTTASGAVAVDLALGGSTGDAQGDTYTSIEHVRGSAFDDLIIGDGNANSLFGNDGADTLDGAGGNDRLEGGDGNDIINGGDGVDTIYGQAGNDTINGDAGNDFMYGSAGGDAYDGGADFDTVSYIQASSGVTVNMQTGGTGGDAAGDSYVNIERLFGSNSGDDITGSDGADSLFGLGGDDFINGGLGNDRMYGGGGDDTFTYDTTIGGADLIYDFRAGTLGDELIIIEGFDPNFDSFAEVMAVATQVGANVRFNFGSGNFLTLVNLDISRLEASDFAFLLPPPAEAPNEDKNALDAEMPVTDMDMIASYLGDAPSGDIGGDVDIVDVDASLYSGEVFDLI